jgi:hypothetical protein
MTGKYMSFASGINELFPPTAKVDKFFNYFYGRSGVSAERRHF